MKLIFAGTPEFAAVSLRALLAGGHRVTLVLTQPDRPAGRGLQLHASPVKLFAEASGIPLLQPPTLRDAGVQQRLAEEAADAMIVAAYGLLLPAPVLALPRHGCINVHASLLPRWRGAAPIQRALLAGDAKTGVAIMAMDAGLDTGAVYRSAETPIAEDDTAQTLHDRLAELGAQTLLATLADLAAGSARALPQADSGATYAGKIDKSEAALDWRRPADSLHRQVCAFDPFPGCTATLAGERLKIWAARLPSAGERSAGGEQHAEPGAEPGEIVAVARTAITVACGSGRLLLTELQKPGGRRLPVADFLAGTPLAAGQRFALG